MKKYFTIIVGFIVLVSLVISACAAPTQSPASTPAPSLSPAPTQAQTKTTAAAAKPTASATPVATSSGKLIIARGASGTSSKSTPIVATQRFVDKANAALAGRVKFEHYPDGQLYQQGDELPAVRNNVLQFTNVTISTLESWEPGWAVFNLPVLFSDEDHYMRALGTDAGKALFQRTRDASFTSLPEWFLGSSPMLLGNSKRPIEKISDFKSLKVRVPISDTNVKTMKLLGASPISMAMGEVAAALQTGTLDGQLTGPPGHNLTIELTPYLLKFSIFESGKLIMFNTDFWNSLPSDVKDKLIPIIKEACDWGRAETYKVEVMGLWDAIGKLQAKGKGKLSDPSAEFGNEIRATLRPLWNEVASSKGKYAQELIDAVNKVRK